MLHYDWEPNVTDLDVAFDELKKISLNSYDSDVTIKYYNTAEQDRPFHVRRRILERNLDLQRESFKKSCEDQKKLYSDGVEKIFKQCKAKANQSCIQIESGTMPIAKADLHAQFVAIDEPIKKEFESAAPGPSGAQRLKDLDDFMDDRFDAVDDLNKKAIAAQYGYDISEFTTMDLNDDDDDNNEGKA